MHLPAIEAASEVGAKTVARPIGLLAGGLCAFFGSVLLLWAAKHYGFRYNYLFFFLVFIGGYFLGLLVEATIKLLGKKHQNSLKG